MAMKLRNGAKRWLRAHPQIATELPGYENSPWFCKDVNFHGKHMRKLAQLGLIEKVDSEVTGGTLRYKWETKPGLTEWINKHIDKQHPGPCNHRGVFTLTAGEEYTCCNDKCDVRFGRDIAQERV